MSPMRARDDLTAAFCRGIPDRIAEATELWLEYEQGRSDKLPVLRRLLHTLMQHKGRVVDGKTLIARVWNSDTIYEDTLRVHIHRLRSKLEVNPRKPKYILTERGIGYSFHSSAS